MESQWRVVCKLYLSLSLFGSVLISDEHFGSVDHAILFCLDVSFGAHFCIRIPLDGNISTPYIRNWIICDDSKIWTQK